jgi:membrane fusion protein (multidrug efflux system)
MSAIKNIAMLKLTGTLVVLSAVGLAACSKAPKEGAGGPMAHMPPAEVTVVTVQQSNVPVNFEYVGQTAGSREVEVRARVTGNIEKRLYEEGGYVKAGQPLFQLDSRPFVLAIATAKAAIATAEADVVKAEAASAQAGRERERMSTLADAHAISRKEADDAGSSAQISSAEVQAARARLEQARAQLKEAQLNLDYAAITAPISGVVGRALRQEGALISQTGDTLLTTLVQLDPLYINFNVADMERQRLEQEVAKGELVLPKAGYQVKLMERDGTPLGTTGKINFISPTVSNQTGTLEMRAQMPNPGNALKSGLFVRVVLDGAVRPNALTVPQRAVLEGPKGKMVMVAVKNKDGALVAEPRMITVGEWVDNGAGDKLWVVRNGLQAGDQVIVEGLMKLHPGAPISLGHPEGQSAASTKGAAASVKS